MRCSVPLAVFFGSFFLVATGCAPPKRPAGATARVARPAEGSGGAEIEHDGIPRVVRRILAEEKELVARSLALASELPDPHGRERAVAEVNDLARELARIEGPLDGADGQTLDDVVARLLSIDTRVALLHDKLRGAANRTTAILVE